MCRAGGRRCPGSGGSSKGSNAKKTANATTPTSPAGILSVDPATQRKAAARSGGAVPTRERADQLAAEIPATRRDAFGRPLNEKDRRFFALRESGYTGPIDQDGYPDTTSDGAGTLRRMARDRGETVNW